MRIVVFNNMITPYTNRLYDRLAQEGVDIAVLSCTAQEANRSWADSFAPSYPHVVLPGRALRLGPGRFAHVNTGIGAALDRLRPDLLLINGFYPSMLAGAWWAARHGVALGLTIDGWAETMPNSWIHRIVRPLVLRRCRTVVTCGRKGRDYFLGQGVLAGRIFTVPLVPAWDAPAETPAFAQRPWHLLWVAHLNNEAKNASFFADVAERLKQRLPGLRVRLVGRGPAEAEILGRLRAADIEFRHDATLDWQDMPQVFATARLFLLPSLWEPWGLVCNEAMQCGTPCIVSPHVGAGGDLVQDGVNGHVVPLDAGLWADRAFELITTPLVWQPLSAMGREEMERRQLVGSVTAFQKMIKNIYLH